MAGAKEQGSGIPAGLSMLIKTFMPGFNPADFGAKIGELQNGARVVVQNFDDRLRALENRSAEITAQNAEIIALIKAGRQEQ
jgi:hypothetical protein